MTGLLYTPVFVNPTLLGAIGGYYNSVYGFTVTLAPTKNTYLNYGLYDGNVARGVQTGLTGPHINGYYFNILEVGLDWVAAGKYPGQFGINNSETLPAKEYFGMGLTGFGLVPHRPDDSIGMGMAWSWLNPNLSNRPSELMFQGYYQAHLYAGTFFEPGISYIPTPGLSSSLGSAWAVTFRFTFLF